MASGWDDDAHEGAIGADMGARLIVHAGLPAGEVVLQQYEGVGLAGGRGYGDRSGREAFENGGHGALSEEDEGPVVQAVGPRGFEIIFGGMEQDGVVAENGGAGLFAIIGPTPDDLFQTGPDITGDGGEFWQRDTGWGIAKQVADGPGAFFLHAGDGYLEPAEYDEIRYDESGDQSFWRQLFSQQVIYGEEG